MTANAKSLSSQASLVGTGTPSDPFQVDVTFTYDPDILPARQWHISPSSLSIPGTNGNFYINYQLSPGSTGGWGFTQITVEKFGDPELRGTYPNMNGYSGVGTINVQIQFMQLSNELIQIAVENTNQESSELKLSVTLTVSDSQGNSITSPDPQVVLEPRPG